MPTISVIMGVYNSSEGLSRCLDSIFRQTYKDFEIVICDDNSSDDTIEIIEKYAKQNDNITLLKNKKNMGLAYSLNRCLKVSKGRYIARLDSDDICLPTRFEKQVEFLGKNKQFDLVGSSAILYDETGDKAIRVLPKEPEKLDLVKIVPFIHPTVMLRKETYDALNGYIVSKRTRRGQDADLWYRFYAQGFKGYNIEEPLIKYHESLNDYNKRSFKVYWYGMQTRFIGYKKMNLPVKYYIYVLKPLLSAIIPHKLMYFYHKKVKGSKIIKD